MIAGAACFVFAAALGYRVVNELRSGNPNLRRVLTLGSATLGSLIVGVAVWL